MDVESREKFEGMYLKYQGVLRRLAYEYEIPPDYIDDVVQDTFVSFAQYDYSLEQSEQGKKILLGRILKSRCMDFHRRLGNKPCQDVDDEDFIYGRIQDTVREAEYSGLCCEQGEMFCHSGGH